MTVRPVRPEELDACCAPGGDDELSGAVRTLWQMKLSSPELCFVAEDQGRLIGRSFFHRHGVASTEFSLFGFYFDGSLDLVAAGRPFLDSLILRLAAAGATSVGYAIYDIYHRDPARMQALIEATGFSQFQEKRRYVWQDSGAAVAVPARLRYRSLTEVGEPAFCDAARRVTEGTLDRDDQADIARFGLEAAGPKYMAVLKDVEFLPDEWLLGFLEDGRLCGLVVPQRLPLGNEGTINYIGVVPELRGSGFGLDLLLAGTARLQRRKFSQVVAETDVNNLPMRSHLEQAGYRHEGSLRGFRLDLTHPAPRSSGPEAGA